MSKKPNPLRSVPKAPPAEPDYARDIYADVRAAALDSERWRRLHERSERAAPLDIFEPPHKRSWTSWER